MIKTSNILLIGGGGLGVIAALSLEASSRAKVTAVLRSNYETVSANGYKISSCEYGEIEGWRPTKNNFVNKIPHPSSNDRVYDYIVITTKNIPGLGRTMAALIAPTVSPGITVIVLIQNGFNIEREYRERYQAISSYLASALPVRKRQDQAGSNIRATIIYLLAPFRVQRSTRHAGNSIEYEYLVGEPMREGLRLGVPMPTISMIYSLCQAVQSGIMQRRKSV
ncbi:unnamed protein product [Fusarium fujikuroi]|nr:unnamed protein product [Fusarium fujikuroi]